MLWSEAGSRPCEGATVAVGGAVDWRLGPRSGGAVDDTAATPRFTALYVVITGEFEMDPSCRKTKEKKILVNQLLYILF